MKPLEYSLQKQHIHVAKTKNKKQKQSSLPGQTLLFLVFYPPPERISSFSMDGSERWSYYKHSEAI